MNEEKHRKSHSYDANSQNFVAKYGISHLTKLISLVFQQAGSFFETHCSALSNGPSSSHLPLLTNLKTHLIIRISKGPAIDGKRETKKMGRDNDQYPIKLW